MRHTVLATRIHWLRLFVPVSSQGTRVVNFHARTEPHSRYAIFFIQSGGQVKNIVLNIILYTTQPQRILSFATRDCARRSIVRHIMRRGRWIITMEFEQRDHNCNGEVSYMTYVHTYVSQNALNWKRNRFILIFFKGYQSQRVVNWRRKTQSHCEIIYL